MRITVSTAQVLAALLAEPDADHYGLELMRAAGLASGTLYPILRRLTEARWLTADWEAIDPVAAGRPARRYYRLTAEGAVEARRALAELRARTSPPDLRTAW
ncbi:PadR family transcriptional regulator [Cryptosporangium arvum]|jgi:DNA-binding PadR family transcriptional regulator|uniref:Putative transcriptional regulator n=1 Tax=Cryptosporangium arvum DSM 44712 TaxID=927661 RepID=A0A010Z2P5_9ACTN|nr:PadR family transcriptional regulator [Cryptosporangium arvum]EXG81693.1 putative transcriptional regulator [Cryptosporangium arvum DSM 44712]